MQLITEQESAYQFLTGFANSAHKTPVSWKGWSVAHITEDSHECEALCAKVQNELAIGLQNVLHGHDGMVVCMPDHSIMLVYPQALEMAMEELHKTLLKQCETEVPSLYFRCFEANDIEILRGIVQLYAGPMRDWESHQSVLRKSEEVHSLMHLLPESVTQTFSEWVGQYNCRDGRNMPYIMVVDDDPITRRNVRKILSNDYPVMTAANAKEAVEKHLVIMPDIVFLDIGLPDFDGFEVLCHITSHDPHCKVVMFSGNSYLTNRVRALSGGADGFIPKPFTPAMFVDYIGQWKQPEAQSALQ